VFLSFSSAVGFDPPGGLEGAGDEGGDFDSIVNYLRKLNAGMLESNL
jgi:hypothetical protein